MLAAVMSARRTFWLSYPPSALAAQFVVADTVVLARGWLEVGLVDLDTQQVRKMPRHEP